jgi:hypothetical protein
MNLGCVANYNDVLDRRWKSFPCAEVADNFGLGRSVARRDDRFDIGEPAQHLLIFATREL